MNNETKPPRAKKTTGQHATGNAAEEELGLEREKPPENLNEREERFWVHHLGLETEAIYDAEIHRVTYTRQPVMRNTKVDLNLMGWQPLGSLRIGERR